jgi:hypothetical protein
MKVRFPAKLPLTLHRKRSISFTLIDSSHSPRRHFFSQNPLHKFATLDGSTDFSKYSIAALSTLPFDVFNRIERTGISSGQATVQGGNASWMHLVFCPKARAPSSSV